MNHKLPSWADVRAPSHRDYFTCIGLALVPMACALVGVALDEHWRLGYSNWLSACRTRGVSVSSVAGFTLQLLPLGVIGLLLGGLVVQGVGIGLRRNRPMIQASLAAHSGCLLGMGAGLLLCTLTLPLPWMLGAEAVFAAIAAAWLFRRIRKFPYPNAGKCVVRLISAQCGATEDSGSSGR